MRKALLPLLALAVALPLFAQQKRLSPPAKAEGSIAGKSITVDYSAPSMRGRKIMGELVPFGTVWRTGANEATTLKTEGDLMIGNLHVPAGTYTLYTLPGANEWTLIVNRQTGQWGTKYDESQDLGRVPMKIRKLDDPVETLMIAIEPIKDRSGTMKFTWETTEVSVPVMVH